MDLNERFQARSQAFCEFNKLQIRVRSTKTAMHLRKNLRMQIFEKKRETMSKERNSHHTPNLCDLIYRLSNPSEHFSSLVSIREFLQETDERSMESLISLGIVPVLNRMLLTDRSEDIILEICWILCILAHSQHCLNSLIDGGIHISLPKALDGASPSTIQYIYWALTYIVKKRSNLLSYYLNSNFIYQTKYFMTEMIKRAETQTTRMLSAFLSAITLDERSFTFANDFIRIAEEALKCEDLETKSSTLSYLENISVNSSICFRLIESEIIDLLLPLIKHIDLQISALGVFANISNVIDEKIINLLLSKNILDFLVRSIVSPNPEARKETLFILSNLVRGNDLHREMILYHRVFAFTFNCIQDVNNSCQIECSFVLRNLGILGSDKLLSYFLTWRTCEDLLVLLRSPDIEILLNTLEFIQNLLCVNCRMEKQFHNDFCDSLCIDELERLVKSQNEFISSMAHNIILNYFGIEEQEEEEDPPFYKQLYSF